MSNVKKIKNHKFQEMRITSILPSSNLEQSKAFFQNVLGLNLISEDPYGVELEGLDSVMRLSLVQQFTPQAFTILGFKVSDIDSEVKSLTTKGVIFEYYDSLDQDELGIWTSPSDAKVAWFKDPEGNVLSLTQYPF